MEGDLEMGFWVWVPASGLAKMYTLFIVSIQPVLYIVLSIVNITILSHNGIITTKMAAAHQLQIITKMSHILTDQQRSLNVERKVHMIEVGTGTQEVENSKEKTDI
ncbi:hypothetical protein ACJX0J_028621, partial [Zea mays]